jgi:hypothetical protein
MIDPKELRIGNWVELKRHGIGRVRHITEGGTIAITDHSAFHSSDYYPIPLTPEILEKCGFYFYSGSIVSGSLRIDPSTMSINFVCDKDNIPQFSIEDYLSRDGDGLIMNHIKSLHQLQNLYFALTGEELIYKP